MDVNANCLRDLGFEIRQAALKARDEARAETDLCLLPRLNGLPVRAASSGARLVEPFRGVTERCEAGGTIEYWWWLMYALTMRA